MRKTAVLCVVFCVLFLLSSCTLPFGLQMQPEEDPSAEAHTFVITTERHTGSDQLIDCVNWYANTLAALEYVGSRDTIEKSLKALHEKEFSSLDAADILELKRVDLGGDDVFLVIPRFDQETMSVFTVKIDSEGSAHILNQAADLKTPFLLLCNSTDQPNAQLSILLTDVNGKFRTVVRRNPVTGDLLCDNSFQPIRLN